MSTGGAVVRALTSHQCGQGSNPGVNTTCGLSLLFILSFALKGFFVLLQFSPLLKNQHFQIPIRPGMVVKKTIKCGASSLLTLNGFCTLSCADHVVHTWKVSSRFKLACPL